MNTMKKLILAILLAPIVWVATAKQTIELKNWKYQSGDNMEWAKPGFVDKEWKTVRAGQYICSQGFPDSGYGWYRIRFKLPSAMKKYAFGKFILFELGKIDFWDQTFLNGELLGQNAVDVPYGTKPALDLVKVDGPGDQKRIYSVAIDDPRLKWDSENVLAVRDYNKWTLGMHSVPLSVRAKTVNDFIFFDISSADFKANPDGTISKSILLKNLFPGASIKGQLKMEITNADNGKTISTKKYDVDLGSEAKSFDISFKERFTERMKATYTFTESQTGQVAFRTQALPYSPNVPGTDVVSGEYYDWTKTMQPDQPFKHDYNKTLIFKIFLCSHDENGDVGKISLKFGEVPDILRKLDQITMGIPKIVYLVGWQFNGHDSKYPSWAEVNKSLKREQDSTAVQSLRWLIREGHKYHTAVSLHINMIDAYSDSPLWGEYLQKDIIAKDNYGNPIAGEQFITSSGKPFQSYQISYAQEWKLGLAQKRIDDLIRMIPELKESGSIHIDAFHTMQPTRPGEPLSPYLGLSINDEIATQRKIFRYWMKQGIDVTTEGAKYWLRNDPFLGLQASTWWFDENNMARESWPEKPQFTTLPASMSCYSPMHCEGEIGNDPINLTGLAEQTCMKLAPWYYKRNVDVNMGGTIILTDEEVICPALWTEKATVACNTKEDIKDKKVKLPTTWVDVKEVQLYDLTVEGLKPRSVLPVTNGTILLSIAKNQPTVIMPAKK